MYVLTLVQRRDKRWGWRLTASNGRVVATDGSQGYENGSDAERQARTIFQHSIPLSHVEVAPRKSLKDKLLGN